MRIVSNPFFKENSGVTLVEVIVTVSLLFVVSSLAYGLYVTSQSLIIRWQRGIHLQSAFHTAQQRLVRDIKTTTRVDRVSEDQLEVVRDGERMVYEVSDGILTRNRHPMHSGFIQTTTFRVGPITRSGEEGGLDVTGFVFEIEMASGIDTLRAEQVIQLRMAGNWPQTVTE